MILPRNNDTHTWYMHCHIERQAIASFYQLSESFTSSLGYEGELDDPTSILQLYFTHKPPVDRIRQAFTTLAESLNLTPPTLQFEIMEDKDWVKENQATFPGFAVGNFYIHNSYDHTATLAHQYELIINPGSAFGTGEHPTTKQCIQILDQLALPSSPSILDLGCGSGILSVAACKKFSPKIVAVDIDPLAISTTKENIIINKLDPFPVIENDGYHHPKIQSYAPFDLIMENILKDTIITFAPHISSLVKPGGFLLVSGILVSQQNEVRKCHQAHHLTLVQELSNDGWCSFLFQNNT